jgi:hypothetical protein
MHGLSLCRLVCGAPALPAVVIAVAAIQLRPNRAPVVGAQFAATYAGRLLNGHAAFDGNAAFFPVGDSLCRDA